MTNRSKLIVYLSVALSLVLSFTAIFKVANSAKVDGTTFYTKETEKKIEMIDVGFRDIKLGLDSVRALVVVNRFLLKSGEALVVVNRDLIRANADNIKKNADNIKNNEARLIKLEKIAKE